MNSIKFKNICFQDLLCACLQSETEDILQALMFSMILAARNKAMSEISTHEVPHVPHEKKLEYLQIPQSCQVPYVPNDFRQLTRSIKQAVST